MSCDDCQIIGAARRRAPRGRAMAGRDREAMRRRRRRRWRSNAAFPRSPAGCRGVPLASLADAGASSRARSGARPGIAELWIKRDDRTGTLYGGNKVRKLEWLLADALRARASDACSRPARSAATTRSRPPSTRASVGLRTLLVLIPQPVTAHVRRTLLLDHAYGATMHFAPTIAAARRTRDRSARPRRAARAIDRISCRPAARRRRHARLRQRRPRARRAGGGGRAARARGGRRAARERRDGRRSAGGSQARRSPERRDRGAGDRPPAAVAARAGAARAIARSRRCARLGADLPRLDARARRFRRPLRLARPGLRRRHARRRVDARRAHRRRARGSPSRRPTARRRWPARSRSAREAPWRDRPLLFWHTYSSVDPAAAVASSPRVARAAAGAASRLRRRLRLASAP